MLEQIQEGFGNAVSVTVAWVPRMIGFLLVLLIGYIVAKVLQRAVDALLERVGFDNAVERGGIRKALSRSRWDASDLLARVVYWVVMLFTLQLAFGVFGPNPVSELLTGVVAYLPNLFAAGLIVVVGAAIAAAVGDLVSAVTGNLSYGRILAVAASTAILVVTGFAALAQLRIAPAIVTGLFYAILATVVGIAVVAIGGGGIAPMRQWWSRALDRVAAEAPALRAETEGAGERARERAEERRRQAEEMVGAGGRREGGGRPASPPYTS